MNRRALAAALALPALLAPLSTVTVAAAADTPDPTSDPTLPPTDPNLSQSIDEDQEIATDDAVLSLGHVDMGPRFLDEEWTLMIHDDTQVEGSVWRSTDNTVIQVADTAVQQIPDDPTYDFIGVEPGTGVHVVPQTQNSEVVWLGWNTQDPETIERVDRGVTMSLAGVEGPGDLTVFLQDGGFGEPDLLWSTQQDSESLFVETNVHTHANWVFSEPGEYAVAIEVDAPLVDGTEVTTTRTLRFAVGDTADTDAALALPDVAVTPDAPDATGAAGPDSVDAGSEAAEDDEGGIGTGLLVVAVVALLLVALAVAMGVRGRSARSRALAGRDSA
jgi:surface-anchored protein